MCTDHICAQNLDTCGPFAVTRYNIHRFKNLVFSTCKGLAFGHNEVFLAELYYLFVLNRFYQNVDVYPLYIPPLLLIQFTPSAGTP